jgi:hypothetical protein
LDSPNNVEKLAKFSKITAHVKDVCLLPHLEHLMNEGRQHEACELLKSIRRLAHVNKNTPKKGMIPDTNNKKQKNGDPSELPSLKSLIPTLIHELAQESSNASPAHVPSSPSPQEPAPSATGDDSIANLGLMREIRSLHHELYTMRQRLNWFEARYPQDSQQLHQHEAAMHHEHMMRTQGYITNKPVIWEHRR